MLDCRTLANGMGTLLTLHNNDESGDGVVSEEGSFSFTVLADPGWSGNPIDDTGDFNELLPIDVVEKIDMIILSQSTAPFCGNYVLLLHQFPRLRNLPVYSTLPVSKMARLSTLELYRSHDLVGAVEQNKIELTQVNNYFNKITCINHSQTLHLSHINNKPINLSITAYNSGYSVGGSIWNFHFNFNNINDKILYAPVWNHSKDEFLNSCKIFNSLSNNNANNSQILHPTALITNADYTNMKLSYNSKINSFLNIVKESLRCGLSVLIPTSLTGRFFELLIPLIVNKKDIMDQYNSQIFMLNYIGLENLSNLSNFLEWMNNSIAKLWESENQNMIPILEDNGIQLCKYNKLLELEDFELKKPRIYFVEENGEFFERFLVDFNKRVDFTLILTSKPVVYKSGNILDSNLCKIYKTWTDHVDSGIQDSKEGEVVDIEIKNLKCTNVKEELLRGKELSNYLKSMTERRNQILLEEQKEELERLKLEEVVNNDDNEEEEDTDDENALDKIEKDGVSKHESNNLSANDPNKNVLITSIQIEDGKIMKLNDVLLLPRDYDTRNLKHKHRMFPMVNYKPSSDDYGKIINSEDFQIFDDDRFPLLNGMSNDLLDSVATENINGTETDIDGNININGERKRKRRRRGGRGSNRRDNAENESLENRLALIKKMSIYSFDSEVEPVSRTYETVNIDIRCAITFIDFSGNHDLRSFKYTIKQMKPRKVILLPGFSFGSKTDGDVIMEQVIDDTQQNILSGKVNQISDTEYIRCKIGEVIKLGNVITSYDLKIDDKLASKLKWQKLADGYSLSYVKGKIDKFKDWDYVLKEDIGGNTPDSTIENNVLIGDIKLTQLRKELIKIGYIVKLLDDGRIVINEEVVVGKGGTGQITVEGGVSELFYKVREVVKGMLASI